MSAGTTAYPAVDPRRRPASRHASLSAPACLVLGVLIGATPTRLGARLENRLFPVLTGQSIPAQSVTRTGRWLCWSWVRDKQRSPAVLGLDVMLETAEGDRSKPEIINSATGLPWHTGGALAPGHYESSFCLVLPEFVGDGQTVRLRQTLTYRGFLGFWNLDIPLPDLVVD